MPTRTMIRCPLAAVIFVAICGDANAQFVTQYTTNFNTPTYVDGALNSSTTSTNTSGQDGWLFSSGTTNVINVSGTATNGVVNLATSGQDVRRPFDSGTTVTSGSVYFRADVRVTTAQAAGDYFIHLGDGGIQNFYGRTFVRSSGSGYQLALGTSSGTTPTYGSAVLQLETSYRILVRYDIVAGASNDTGALYVDPTTTDGSGDPVYVAATNQGTDATTIAAVYLRQGGAGNAPAVTVDNVTVFTPVPEPASVLAIGFAALGLARLAHRRFRA